MQRVRRRLKYCPDREIVDAVYRHSPAGTKEIADIVGISRQGADHRLRSLEDEGKIWSKKVGPTPVWMHPRVLAPGTTPGE